MATTTLPRQAAPGPSGLATLRTIQPLFTRRAVDGYAADFAAATLDTLRSWPDRGRVDLDAAMRELTVRAASVTLFGLDAHDLVAPMLGDVVTMSEMVMERAFRPIPHVPLLHGRSDRRFEELRTRIEDAIVSMVAKRNAEVSGTDDLVGLLQSAEDPETGEPLSEQDVLDQAVVFLLAGHETTSTALTFALWELARRPALQARVRQEARAALPEDGEADAAAIHRLELTRRVLDEAMRLHPPVPITARSVEGDNELDGFLVQDGEVVIVDIASAHTDSEHWDDPQRFDPDRFLPEVAEHRDRYAYLPFGGGPPSCIGITMTPRRAARWRSTSARCRFGSARCRFGSEWARLRSARGRSRDPWAGRRPRSARTGDERCGSVLRGRASQVRHHGWSAKVGESPTRSTPR